MSIHDDLRPVLSELADVLDRIDPADDARPTPCDAFDVAALRAHVLQWLTSFATGLAHPTGQCPVTGVDVEGRGGDQVRLLAERIEGTRAHLPEQLVIGGEGLPVDLALGMILGEYLVHGWDLSAATEQAWTPDEAACARTADLYRRMLTDEASRGSSFGPAVDVRPEASELEKLLGVTGRDPSWTRC